MTTKCENVISTSLTVGDIVHCHGGRFELVACTFSEAEAHDSADKMRTLSHLSECEMARLKSLRAFQGRYLGDVCESSPCAIPVAWRTPFWNVQGNHNATWSREVRAV